MDFYVVFFSCVVCCCREQLSTQHAEEMKRKRKKKHKINACVRTKDEIPDNSCMTRAREDASSGHEKVLKLANFADFQLLSTSLSKEGNVIMCHGLATLELASRQELRR